MERTRTHNLAVGSVCKLRAETLPTQPPRHPTDDTSHGTTERNLNHLQKVQNATARIVHQASFQTSATALRHQLHWLPIRQRITYKAKYCWTPLYLREQLRDHQVARTLRSTTAPLFYRPFVCPLSSPLGHSTTLHLKFGTVSGHPQDRRTLSVVLCVA